VLSLNGQPAKYYDQGFYIRKQKGKPFLQYCDERRTNPSYQQDGKLGIEIAIKFAPMKKLGYYKVSKQELVSWNLFQ
jgi:hypothetical protein